MMPAVRTAQEKFRTHDAIPLLSATLRLEVTEFYLVTSKLDCYVFKFLPPPHKFVRISVRRISCFIKTISLSVYLVFLFVLIR